MLLRLLPLLLFLISSSAQSAYSPLEKFDRYATRSLNDWKVPTATVIVIKNGAIVFSSSYGEKNSLDTPYNLGTLSGTLSSQGIIALAEEEKLTLDDPMVTHLRSLFPSNLDYSEQLTLRDLITHRTGIPHREGDRIWRNVELTDNELIDRIGYLNPSWGLRYRFGYQSIMMAPLAKVIEKTSGKPWEAYLKARIWDPIGMSSTGTSSKPRPLTTCQPGVGIATTPLELAQWTKMLLAKGDWEGTRIFEEETVAEMFTPQIPLGKPQDSLDITLFAGYGLGWAIQDYRGQTLCWHNGISDTDHTFVGIFPEKNIGVLVFTNEPTNRLAEGLGLRIADLYLGLESRDWTRIFMKITQPLAFEKLRKERSS